MSDSGEEEAVSPSKMETEEDSASYKPLPFEDRKMHGELYRMISSGADSTERFLQDHAVSLDMYFTIECVIDTGCSCDFLEEIIGNSGMLDPLDDEVAQIESGHCPLGGATEPGQVIRKVGCSLIHTAVRWNNLSLLQSYIQAHGDPNLQTLQSKLSLLHFAVRAGSTQCVQALLAAGADVNILDSMENSPLLYACSEENVDLMKWLIEAGSDINHVDCTQESALLNAVRNGFVPGVQLLVDMGVDVNAAPPGVPVPILEACDLRNMDIVKILVKSGQCEVDKVNRDGRQSATCLQRMIYSGQEEMVDLLLEAGADPNKRHHVDMVSIIIAVMTEQLDIVKKLIAHGADVNAVDRNMYSALHLAAWDGYADIVGVLLAANALHDRHTLDFNTPVALACHGGHDNVVQLLLPLGCNLNNKDKDQDTALHYCSYNGNLDTVRSLLQHGAHPDPHNSYSATPLWNAVSQQHIQVALLLLTSNVSLDVSSCGINQHSQEADVVLLYDTPRSLLHMACAMGRLDIMTLLVAAGVNLSKERCFRLYPSAARLALFTNPLTLKQLSRIAVRRCLGTNIAEDAKSLFIPATLKSYLIYFEL